MIDALHNAGHKYLKVLFVLALAGSSSLFFIGPALPKPPALVVVIVGAVLGLALEWSYFCFSCDLTEAITEGNKAGIAVNALYTLAGGLASWFLFTNAALHVGWAPTDDLLGLSRTTWAMIMAGLIVVVIFILSARRKRSNNAADLQSIGRVVTLMLPTADDATRLHLLSTIARAASESQGPRKALPPAARVVEEDEPEEDDEASAHKPAASHTVNKAAATLARLGADPVAALEAMGYHIVPKETVQPEQRSEGGEVLGDGPAIQRALASSASQPPTKSRLEATLPPMAGVRSETSAGGANHHNQGEKSGSYERWMPGSESADGPSFR